MNWYSLRVMRLYLTFSPFPTENLNASLSKVFLRIVVKFANPDKVLRPSDTWDDKAAYEDKYIQLASLFVENFKKFKEETLSHRISLSCPVTYREKQHILLWIDK